MPILMDWCDVCKYNPPDYLSHEPDKPCGDCWVYGEENEPTKFAETDNRQTNADRIRAMTDEELAEEIVKCRNADIFRRDVLGRWMYATDEWIDWLKSPVEGYE